VFTVNKTDLHRWWIPIATAALLFSVLLFLIPYNSGDTSITSPLGFALASVWWNSDKDAPDYTYCLLVPLMVGYVLYERRRQVARAPQKSNDWALLWVVLGLALFWIGARAGKQYLGCVGVQILLLGLINWFWGGAVFRLLIFGWAIIAFAWPLPFVDTAIAFPLRMIVSHAAHFVLNLVGISCLQSGTALLSAPTASLQLGDKFQIDVADPCSGLHSLLPLLMFSSFYCYFFLSKLWQQWLVFLSAFVFAIAGNVARIIMLVIGCLFWGSTFAIGPNDKPSTYHEACGFAVFVIVLGLECLFGSILIRLTQRWSKNPVDNKTHQPASATVAENPTRVVPTWRSASILGVAAVMLIVFLATPPVYLPSEAGVLMSLPEQVKVTHLDGGDFYGSEAAVSDVEHRMLPKDTEFARKTYEDFHDHQVFFSIVLSGVQQYTIHPPEVCLVAQGWSIVNQEDIPIHLESGHQLTVRNLTLQRQTLDSQHQPHTVKAYYMYWYVADNLTTPSHLERNLVSSWDRVVHNRDHRWAYVIAMSPITKTFFPDGMNADQTRDMLTNFIREIVPTFQKNELRNSATADNL
jgi:EpsI family protein